MCATISSTINRLVDWAHTRCLPAGGRSRGSRTLLLITEAPVLTDPVRRKGWLLVACVGAGEQLQKHRSLKVDEVWFSDLDALKRRVAYTVPAETCRKLHVDFKAERTDLDGGYRTINAALTEKPVTR